MKNHITALGFFCTTLLVAATPSSMQEGLWETSSQATILGAKTQAPPSVTRACYTQNDVERENVAIPKDERCAINDYQLVGNTATWTIACAGNEKITGNGSLTFHGRTAYSGSAKLRMVIEGQPDIHISNSYSAKRIGDCPR